MSHFMWGDFFFLIASMLPFIVVIVLVIVTSNRLKKRGQRLRTLEQRIEQLEKNNLSK
ncbi:hypothetical protein [Brochothrix campestris]|uniref:hypothetical protein n=1 Tax=Brochothrix campestris TaxID=2757 RepID=UPI0004AF22F5|nr:hypothetical protein [Brochothrix campestris]